MKTWKKKKTHQKVAYLSRISVVSEISAFSHITAQQPKWQNSCSQMWPIEQLYIELGYKPNNPSDIITVIMNFHKLCCRIPTSDHLFLVQRNARFKKLVNRTKLNFIHHGAPKTSPTKAQCSNWQTFIWFTKKITKPYRFH